MDKTIQELEAKESKENTISIKDKIAGNTTGTLQENQTSLSDKFKEMTKDMPFLQKVWHMMEGWAHGNKAFRIIAILPLFALATLLAFWRRKGQRYNLTEHMFIQAYIACQTLLISVIVLPFNGTARVNKLYEVPIWIVFILSAWTTNNCTAALGGRVSGVPY